MRKTLFILFIVFSSLLSMSCVNNDKKSDQKLLVVTTTSMLGDIVQEVAGDFVTVRVLMSPGIDPHQYKASEGDVIKLASADMILHNGLHLEGKLGEVLGRIQSRVKTVNASEMIPRGNLIYNFENPDPHIWFDPQLWILAVNRTADALVELDPANEILYRRNENLYVQKLLQLYTSTQQKLEKVPKAQRVLLTSHDAFSYFGKAFGWNVIGIQGINTQSETSVNAIQSLAKTVVSERINCIFTETSVSARSVNALIASVNAMGGTMRKGKPLYSDSLGGKGSGAESYIDMFNANVDSIISGILNE